MSQDTRTGEPTPPVPDPDRPHASPPGLTRRREIHLYLAGVFTVLWIGTFITGIFFLPHTP